MIESDNLNILFPPVDKKKKKHIKDIFVIPNLKKDKKKVKKQK